MKYFHHSVLNLLFSFPPSKNVKIKRYKTIIILPILYECETWLLAEMEGHTDWGCFRTECWEHLDLREEVTDDWRKMHVGLQDEVGKMRSV